MNLTHLLFFFILYQFFLSIFVKRSQFSLFFIQFIELECSVNLTITMTIKIIITITIIIIIMIDIIVTTNFEAISLTKLIFIYLVFLI